MIILGSSSEFFAFITSKSNRDKADISLNIQGKIQQDQRLVAEEFTSYFSTVADDIGGSEAASLTEDKCSSHPSIEMISTRHTPNSFRFKSIERDPHYGTSIKTICSMFNERVNCG